MNIIEARVAKARTIQFFQTIGELRSVPPYVLASEADWKAIAPAGGDKARPVVRLPKGTSAEPLEATSFAELLREDAAVAYFGDRALMAKALAAYAIDEEAIRAWLERSAAAAVGAKNQNGDAVENPKKPPQTEEALATAAGEAAAAATSSDAAGTRLASFPSSPAAENALGEISGPHIDFDAALRACGNQTRRVYIQKPAQFAHEHITQLRHVVGELREHVAGAAERHRFFSFLVGIVESDAGYRVCVNISSPLSLRAIADKLARCLRDGVGLSPTDFEVLVPNALRAQWGWARRRHETARPALQIGVNGLGASTLFTPVDASERAEHVIACAHAIFGDQPVGKVEVSHPADNGDVLGVADSNDARYPPRMGAASRADAVLVRLTSEWRSSESWSSLRFDATNTRRNIVGIGAVKPGEILIMFGAASGRLEGRVRQTEVDGEIIQGLTPDGQQVTYIDHFLVDFGEQCPQPGDSGAPLVRELAPAPGEDASLRPVELVGMHIAGPSRVTGDRPRSGLMTSAVVVFEELGLSADALTQSQPRPATIAETGGDADGNT